MIEVKNLTKSYYSHRAINNLSFDVNKGEIIGFLGPNGAGKTTTMRILTCYMPPTSGTVTIDGLDVETHSLRVRKKIGYLPESVPLYPDMSAFEYLNFIAEIRHIKKNERTERIKDVVSKCGLKKVIRKDINELSKGYKQRLCFAQSIIHNPDILILDEPTSGLDPNQIVEIRELIKSLGKEKTVILSTHILSEVQATCSRVLIINEGKIIADGTPAELQKRARGKEDIYLKLKGPHNEIKSLLKEVEGVSDVEQCDTDDTEIGGYRVLCNEGMDLRETLFKTAVNNNWIILEMKKEIISLEAVFRKLTSN